LPIVPIIVGVVVLGFVIGAGLSVAGRGRWSSGDVAVVASATPVAQSFSVEPKLPTPIPARAQTPPPLVTSLPKPASSQPAASPSLAATALPAFASAQPAAQAAAAAPSQTPAPAANTTAVAATASPATAAPATAGPATATPATAPNVAAPSEDVDGGFAQQAASVVRTYLAAIARGDVDGAYAELAGTSKDTPLPEVGIITSTSRITHLESHGGPGAATVDVDLQTDAGFYAGQYTVHRSALGTALIVEHTIVKP
jgi:hypothetical protein